MTAAIRPADALKGIVMNSPAIEADGLKKAFGMVTALDGLSFQVSAGSVRNPCLT
jgi:hypothetical protein